MGKVNECPYCGELRDEDNKCCYNWGQCLKLDKLFIHPVARETANQSPISADTTSINEMEEEKMGKIARTTIVVTDVVAGVEYPVTAEQAPRPSEPGMILTLKVNAIGQHYLQQNKGLIEETVNQANFEKWFCENTGMPVTGLKALGTINVATGEGSDKWGVKVGNDITFPQGVVASPVAAEEPAVSPADTSPVVGASINLGQPIQQPTAPAVFTDEVAIAKINEFIDGGKFTHQQIIAGLSTKVTPQKAQTLLGLALASKTEVKKAPF